MSLHEHGKNMHEKLARVGMSENKDDQGYISYGKSKRIRDCQANVENGWRQWKKINLSTERTESAL